ncbi:TonB-dependent receptor [Siphonobacter sp. SORGH_AS_1065]|uniref:SusC/RagA family TonB-linked outer membrane protein n=1 Tax=Siphonobacter sp. SORGH_AS_1065 TaxID=3041795 RepID=UPI00277D61AB|nr:TonB-dependent receptor [Siphonobacter sp. SORGH_AS_1065]MDQ1085458.1 TonB-linked SusC/RagA family outer membrane protein [Siphonobacter sp. SORGH_AS_1065]
MMNFTQSRHREWLLAFFLVLMQVCTLSAQSLIVRGRVTADNGEALPGVTVVVKNTTTGTTTDTDGRYTLRPGSSSGILVFSYLGTTTQEVPFNGAGEYNAVLSEESKKLNEVVVVGYGTQKKVNLTGSVAIIDPKTLTNRQVGSTSLALQGAAPGVTITQQSGVPGGDAGTIRIRGVGSINAGQSPLILVDNVEMSLDAIDPNNIASISILKDAAAAAVYGSRAANGVVLVTTKRGAKGVNISYNSYALKQSPTDLPKKVSALEHMMYWDVAQANSGLPATFTQQIAAYQNTGPDNKTIFNTDWQKLVLTNSGLMQNHSLTLSVGGDRIKTFASGSFLNQNGLTANTNYKRLDLRFNTDISITKKLNASVDLVLNNSNRLWPGQSSPQYLIREMIGLPAITPGRFDTGQWGEGWANSNPAAKAQDGGFDRSLTDSRIIKGTLTYTPIEGLELLATYSSNYYTNRARNFVDQYDIYSADVANNTMIYQRSWPALNSLSDNISQNNQNLFRAQATYTKALGKHAFTGLAGFSTEDFKTSFINTFRQNLLSPDRPYLSSGDQLGQTLNGGESRFSMVSAYARLNYTYDERYLLEVNGRWDASSRFRENNWWKLFPSVSGGWRISQESFWESLRSTISEAKIRASYGSLGNQNLIRGGAADYYPTYALFNSGTAYNYYFGNVVVPGYALTNAANAGIRWETSRILDLGLDMSLLKNRLNLTADFFQRDIVDMLQLVPIPSYVGLTAPFVNSGSMRNKGWELGLGWRDKVGAFSYQVQLNASDVKNTLLRNGGKPIINGATIQQEGSALDSYYGYLADGFFQTAEEVKNAPFHYGNTAPGDIRYRDISGPDGKPDGKIDGYDRTILGNYFPRYEYSLNLSGQYKGFDFTVFLQGVGKKDNYLSGTAARPFFSSNFQGTMFEYQKDSWSSDNTNAAYPRLTVNSMPNNYVTSSFWVRSAAYLRLKNMVVGYTLPTGFTNKARIKSARIYLSGQNLITWTNFFPGFDPEQRDTGGEFYPIMRTYTVGLNLNF